MPVQGMDLTGIVIIVSDRIYSGERKDRAGLLAEQLLTAAGVDVTRRVIIPRALKLWGRSWAGRLPQGSV